MTKSGADIDTWSGSGYVDEYTNASGEIANRLIPDTGNDFDYIYFAEYFGLERGGLFVYYSEDQDELGIGTTGAQYFFRRE